MIFGKDLGRSAFFAEIGSVLPYLLHAMFLRCWGEVVSSHGVAAGRIGHHCNVFLFV